MDAALALDGLDHDAAAAVLLRQGPQFLQIIRRAVDEALGEGAENSVWKTSWPVAAGW